MSEPALVWCGDVRTVYPPDGGEPDYLLCEREVNHTGVHSDKNFQWEDEDPYNVRPY